MQGQPLAELQSGVQLYRDELAADSLASRRVEVAVVTFGGEVKAECQFVEAAAFNVPQLAAGGDTPMAQAVVTGLDMLQQRKNVIRQAIGGLYRPGSFSSRTERQPMQIRTGGQKQFAAFAKASKTNPSCFLRLAFKARTWRA